MKAEFFAILTALCWAIGSYFEKKGVKLGGFTPVLATTIRTSISLLFLGALSYPFWGELKTGGYKAILLIAIGGGIIAGGLGILCLYSALKTGQLSTVLTIAFCLTPVIGTLLGMFVLKEKLIPAQLIGILLTITGATLTVLFSHH